MMRVVPKVTLEVPEVCTVPACCLLLTRFAIGYFADVCRSPLRRAAAREICLHMRRDPNTSYSRMRGWILPNRLRLTAINMISVCCSRDSKRALGQRDGDPHC